MDWYGALKLIHIVGAIVWAGGGLVLFVSIIRAIGLRNDVELTNTIRREGWYPPRFFGPASLAILLSGIAMGFLHNLWGQLWLVLGLIGIAANFVMIPLIGGASSRLEAAADRGDFAAAAGIGRRAVMPLIGFDLVLLFVIVADMVLKPAPDSWLVLTTFAAVLVAAAVVWLVPALRAGVGAQPAQRAGTPQ